MKNRDLIAMLSALPQDADVLVHVASEDDDDCMGEPRTANSEFDCNDNEVIRLHCDGAFVEAQPWPVWAARLEKFMRERMDLNADEGVSLDDVTDHIAEMERQAEKAGEFKTYVHQRLDDAGVPKYPNGLHSKAGCRVGDRLDLVLSGERFQKAQP